MGSISKKRQTTDVDSVIGIRLRAIRLQAGWSQTELANKLDVTFQQIQKYEKGSNRLSAASLYQISQMFGLSLNYFFDETAFGEFPMQPDRPAAVGNRSESRLLASYRLASPAVRARFLSLLQAATDFEEGEGHEE